jgi:hypothetical protein
VNLDQHDGQFKIPHAHTVSVDPMTHLVYFPLENVEGHPLLRIMQPATTITANRDDHHDD